MLVGAATGASVVRAATEGLAVGSAVGGSSTTVGAATGASSTKDGEAGAASGACSGAESDERFGGRERAERAEGRGEDNNRSTILL